MSDIRKTPLTVSGLIEALAGASLVLHEIERNPLPAPPDAELGDVRRWRSDLSLARELVKAGGLDVLAPPRSLAGSTVAGRGARRKGEGW